MHERDYGASIDISRITANHLWQACVLLSIVETTFYFFNDEFDAEGNFYPLLKSNSANLEGGYWPGLHWESGVHCCLIDHDADQGVLWFHGDDVVGAVFNHEDGPRSPYRKRDDNDPPFTFDYHDVWQGMPDHFWPIVEQELAPRMTFPNSDPRPGISGGLWSEGGYLRTAEPWPEVVEHGAFVLEEVLRYADPTADRDAIFSKWTADYELSPSQIAAVRSYFSRRIATPREQPVSMTPEEINLALS